MTSIKAALIINEQCLDVKAIILKQGEGYILLQEPMDMVAGELSDELLQELLQQKEATKRKRSHVRSTASAQLHSAQISKCQT